MAKNPTIGDLINWSMRGRWADRFGQVLEDYLIPACEETGLQIEDVAAIIGEDLFMSTVWACAFEDFLTREFGDRENAIDDYLKRQAGKESASARGYIAALRNSTMSLYEVSGVVPGASFRARDLIRGGEPVLISERSATRSLKPWDRIAARVVQVGSKMQIGGGVLAFDHETSEIVEALRRFVRPGNGQKPQLAKASGQNFDDAVFSDLSPEERIRAIGPMLTSFWLVNAIERVQTPRIPDLRNSDGDELVLCEVHYPLAARVKAVDIRAVLATRPEFSPAGATSWNWIGQDKPAAASRAGKPSQRSLTFETRHEDGMLLLGHIELKKKALVLSVNSRQRADLGRALLSEILGRRVGQPSVKAESVEQLMASRAAAEPQELVISEDEHLAIIHDQMERHYRSVLDEPVPALSGETPRAAVKTASGRIKVAEWLKMMENQTAKSADHNSAMASYDFSWLWAELGISELRR